LAHDYTDRNEISQPDLTLRQNGSSPNGIKFHVTKQRTKEKDIAGRLRQKDTKTLCKPRQKGHAGSQSRGKKKRYQQQHREADRLNSVRRSTARQSWLGKLPEPGQKEKARGKYVRQQESMELKPRRIARHKPPGQMGRGVG